MFSTETGEFFHTNKQRNLPERMLWGGFAFLRNKWQGQQDSNPRPTVLETVALPTELYPCVSEGICTTSARFLREYVGKESGFPGQTGRSGPTSLT